MPDDSAKAPASKPRSLVEEGPITFDPTRDYTGVEMQQGRVPVDPDSNEQGTIDGRRPPVFEKRTAVAKVPKTHDGK